MAIFNSYVKLPEGKFWDGNRPLWSEEYLKVGSFGGIFFCGNCGALGGCLMVYDVSWCLMRLMFNHPIELASMLLCTSWMVHGRFDKGNLHEIWSSDFPSKQVLVQTFHKQHWGVGKSARQVALMEQLEQAKKELLDANVGTDYAGSHPPTCSRLIKWEAPFMPLCCGWNDLWYTTQWWWVSLWLSHLWYTQYTVYNRVPCWLSRGF